MRSRLAQDALQNNLERRGEKARGLGRSVIGLNAARATQIAIADVSKLPVAENTTLLQNADGLFLFLPGFSVPGGGDVPA